MEQPGRNNQPRQPSTGNGDVSSDESLMVSLINRERAGAGLAALTQDALLSRLAGLKARDFIDNNYFSHTSPTYGTYKSMLTSYGVKYVNAGENLAVSYSVTSAHAALMKSSGNKANILSPKYSRVGVGIAVKGNYMYIVEMFTDGGTGSGTGSGTGGGSNGGSTGGTTGGTTTPPTGSGGQTGSGDTGTAAGLTADEQRMLSLVNAERAAGGLQPLKANLKLTEVARLKAKDMISKNYFDHTSPTYGSPFDMMRQFGITYRTAGENLAGAPSVDIAHTSLMNSPGHRANIMNSSFREVGIGIVDGGPYGKMFVQMFIG
ncbi:MAG: CAP domain-containing protein [Bacillota bacterium]